MATTGQSAAMNGDKLETMVVSPAWPQTIEKLGVQGGTQPETGLGQGDLLIRQGFQITGQSAAKAV